jgi:hypothetical protein
MAREKVVTQKPDDLPALADGDLGIEGKPVCDFSAQLRAADWLPDDKGTRRSDVDDIEVPKLLGERSWSEGSVTPDVDTPQKDYECHELLPLATLKDRCVGHILLLALRIQRLCRLFPVRAVEAPQRKGRDINAVDAANIDRPCAWIESWAGKWMDTTMPARIVFGRHCVELIKR